MDYFCGCIKSYTYICFNLMKEFVFNQRLWNNCSIVLWKIGNGDISYKKKHLFLRSPSLIKIITVGGNSDIFSAWSSSGTLEPHLSVLLWMAMLVSLAIVIVMPQPHGIRALIASTILRLIFSVGLEPTLFLLGAFNVSVCSCVSVRFRHVM